MIVTFYTSTCIWCFKLSNISSTHIDLLKRTNIMDYSLFFTLHFWSATEIPSNKEKMQRAGFEMCSIMLLLRFTAESSYDKSISGYKSIRRTECSLYPWICEPGFPLESQEWEWRGKQTFQIQGSSRVPLCKDVQRSCREGREKTLHLYCCLIDSVEEMNKPWPTFVMSLTCICWHGGTEQPSLQSLCRPLPPHPGCRLHPPSPLHLSARARPWQWQAARAPWRPTALRL